jgi:rubrerythrin
MGSEAGGSQEGDIALLREALALEEAAVSRYVEHAASTSDPRLQTYWESLRRNEAGHRGLLQAELARLGATPGQPGAQGQTAAQDGPGSPRDPKAGGR